MAAGVGKSPGLISQRENGGRARNGSVPAAQALSTSERRRTEAVQRTTRALPPPMVFSTSLTVAMEVSPGVVMASAPWAAP